MKFLKLIASALAGGVSLLTTACSTAHVDTYETPVIDKDGHVILSVARVNEIKRRIDSLCESHGLRCNLSRDYDGKNGPFLVTYVRNVSAGSSDTFFSVFLETDGRNLSASVGVGDPKNTPNDIQAFEAELLSILKDAVGPDAVRYYWSSSTPL